jgi:hypothetical protein
LGHNVHNLGNTDTRSILLDLADYIPVAHDVVHALIIVGLDKLRPKILPWLYRVKTGAWRVIELDVRGCVLGFLTAESGSVPRESLLE